MPHFKGEALMPDGQYKPINLADYEGKWLVLFFYPLDFSTVCPTEIQSFNQLHEQFEKAGAVLVGASVDSVNCHLAWTEHVLGKLAFPLIGDLTRGLAQGCGVLSAEGFANRATFIVNPDGIVESVTINSSKVGRSTEETLRTLLALQAGGSTACGWQPGQSMMES